jgi:Flp pilus assembly protein TadG
MNMPISSRHTKPAQIARFRGPTLCENLPGSEVKLERVCQMCRKQRRGAAVVEFAVVAPVLFVLVFGIIEYGRMVMVQQVLTNASREGARVGVLDPPAGQTSLPIVTSTINNYLTAAGISGATVTAYISADSGSSWSVADPSAALYGQMVKIKISVPFTSVSWLPTPIWLGGKTLQASTVMRRETVQ